MTFGLVHAQPSLNLYWSLQRSTWDSNTTYWLVTLINNWWILQDKLVSVTVLGYLRSLCQFPLLLYWCQGNITGEPWKWNCRDGRKEIGERCAIYFPGMQDKMPLHDNVLHRPLSYTCQLSRLRVENFDLTPAHACGPISQAWLKNVSCCRLAWHNFQKIC